MPSFDPADHQPSLARPVDFGPVSVTCSCGKWSIRGFESVHDALRAHHTHTVAPHMRGGPRYTEEHYA